MWLKTRICNKRCCRTSGRIQNKYSCLNTRQNAKSSKFRNESKTRQPNRLENRTKHSWRRRWCKRRTLRSISSPCSKGGSRLLWESSWWRKHNSWGMNLREITIILATAAVNNSIKLRPETKRASRRIWASRRWSAVWWRNSTEEEWLYVEGALDALMESVGELIIIVEDEFWRDELFQN